MLTMGRLESFDEPHNALHAAVVSFASIDPSVSQALGDRPLPAIYPVHDCNSSEIQQTDDCVEICGKIIGIDEVDLLLTRTVQAMERLGVQTCL